jgi:hypothetical protein
MPERIRFMEHKARRILWMDFTGLTGENPETLVAIERARRTVAALPKQKTLLTMTDFTNTKPSLTAIEALKTLAKHNTPWVLAAALVGVPPILRLLVRLVSLTTGRKMAVFRTVAEAKDWLAQQTAPPESVPEQYLDDN